MIKYKELSNVDLLKLAICENNNDDVVTTLINKFGSVTEIMIHSTEEELSTIKGFGPKKVAQIIAYREIYRKLYEDPIVKGTKISSPADVYNLIGPSLIHKHVEHFKILLLNTKNVVTSIEQISTGTLNASIVHPRDVFKVALKKNSNAILLIHNHPSGDPTPSNEDISITNRLMDAGNLLGVKVLDHIIIGSVGKFLSFKDKNLI